MACGILHRHQNVVLRFIHVDICIGRISLLDNRVDIGGLLVIWICRHDNDRSCIAVVHDK